MPAVARVRDCSGYPLLPAAYVLHVRAKKIGTKSPVAALGRTPRIFWTTIVSGYNTIS